MLVNTVVHDVLDRHAIPRMLDELLWSLRRAGVPVSPAQAIDWVRAVEVIGFGARAPLREAIVAIVAKDRAHVAVVERVFDAFFSGERLRGDLFQRLRARGLTEDEANTVRGLVVELERARTAEGGALATALLGGAGFDRLLALAGARIEAFAPSIARGWVVEQARAVVGGKAARGALGALSAQLRDAFGDARGEAIAALLEGELLAADADVKAMVDARRAARAEADRAREERLATRPFRLLNEDERVRVRRAVKLVAEKMAGAERVSRRHALRGRFDARGTIRRALRTGGVPIAPVFRARRRGKPKLVLLCDVSDSVRGASELLLEIVQTAQAVFPATRSFVFVRDVGEATRLLLDEPPERARERIAAGAIVPVTENSSYGRVLRLFAERHGRDLDKRTTLVVLGDGRTNWVDDGAPLLDVLRHRVRALVWLCPESPSQWSVGDSAMARFAPKCTEVLDVSSVDGLARAAQRLRRLRG